MGAWLARCPIALLAYDHQRYAERSSGMLWQWAASRAALQRPLAAVGYGSGWLAAEAAALGLGWHSPEAIAAAASALPSHTPLNTYGQQVLGEGSFGAWCARQLGNQVGPRLDVGNARSEPRRPSAAGGGGRDWGG